jgi:hypothetical protein
MATKHPGNAHVRREKSALAMIDATCRLQGRGAGAQGEGAAGANDVQLLFEYASEKFVYVVLLEE